MKKRWAFIPLAVVCLLLIGGIVMVCMSGKPETLSITPQVITKTNYNNYLFDNDVDYKGSQFMWVTPRLWGQKLTMVDDQGHQTSLTHVCAPFQIAGEQIVYRKNHELRILDTDTGETAKIAENADRFVVDSDQVVYSTVSVFDDRDGQWKNELYRYDRSTGSRERLYRDVMQFYLHEGKLFAVNYDNWLVEISLEENTVKNVIRLSVEEYPFYVMSQGHNVVYWQNHRLNFMDLDTGNVKTVSLGDSSYTNDRVNYIGNDDKVFVSFQATKTNGSQVTDVRSENNGVWAIDPQTLKAEKVCPDVFERLYLFGDDWLLGTKAGSLYRIDLTTKQAVKITD